jgi:hypothetical protein
MTAPNVPPREEINGDALLKEVHGGFGRYVVFPSAEAHDAVVLWCAATHCQPAWEHAPRLTLTSPEKRCGKSRLMDIARGDLLPAARHGQREHGRCGPLNHRRPADLNG